MDKKYPNINEPALPVLKITDQQLINYVKCPNEFYFKYMSKIPVDNRPTFHQLVNNVINAYMAKLMDGKVMTINQAKRMWDKYADEYPEILTDKRVLDGFGFINQMDRYCRQNRVIVADVGSEYHLTFKNNVILTGKLGIIRYNNNKLELFIPETSQKMPEDFMLAMSTKITLQVYAIEKTAGCKLTGIHIYHIKSGKEIYITRGQKDYNRLEKLVKDVATCIRNNVFYPREDYLCSQCGYKIYCGYV